ncbi:hypothetical protein QN277_024312 [Acacia crassicarpa]|uniref:SHSP domain-containing protein n=1 Tax=Acacia crassicarpa TaxID=499986 RepID=A0AAE1JDG1_9FABA|nr:hypothetical protein QN277_024312 [Acacia crassicarpa]
MALARLALKQLQQRVGSASASSLVETRPIGSAQKLLQRSFSTESAKSDNKTSEVTVSEGKKSRLFPRRQRRRWPWRNEDRDFPPALTEFFPSGLGNALMQATDNINRLFESMNITPWSLSGRVKEKDDHYKLRYEMPGIPKEKLKITIDDGVLTIRGEHREENHEEEDDEFWSSSSYGYYNTSVVLPDDAKTDQVKAELKDGVLTLTIPRTEKSQKDVKHVSVQ